MDSILAEGPVWHHLQQKLFWVDIEKKEVNGFEPLTRKHIVYPVSKRVSAIIPAENDTFILALQGEIAEMDLPSGMIRTVMQLESTLPHNRCNDGKCDPAGRFWIGTMHLDCNRGEGSLYCIDQPFHITQVLKNLTIANGMGWSPDGQHMYFIDSDDRNVKRFTFNKNGCELLDEKIILQFKNTHELPDGMCVDAEGMLWIAFWGGKRVGRYNPGNGMQLAQIEVPASQVTSCCFGGKDLTTIFITTARRGLSKTEIVKYPLSGSLFSCKTDVSGLETNFFRANI